MPNITGTVDSAGDTGFGDGTGALSSNKDHSGAYAQNWYGAPNGRIVLDASKPSKIYGKSTTVQPPSCKTVFCIKY